MKTVIFSVVAAFASVGAFADATIDRVLVRQQWPWTRNLSASRVGQCFREMFPPAFHRHVERRGRRKWIAEDPGCQDQGRSFH